MSERPSTALCFACGEYKPSEEYSNKQIHRQRNRRCPDCIANDRKTKRPNHWKYQTETETDADFLSKPFWSKLPGVPATHGNYTNPVALNDNELIIGTQHESDSRLYKYSTHHNEWSLHMHLSQQLHVRFICDTLLALDTSRQQLHCYDSRNHTLLVIDLQSSKCSEYDAPYTYCGNTALLLFMNDELHLQAGDGQMAHYIFHAQRKQFDKVCDLHPAIPDMGCRAAVYKENANELLLYGGDGGRPYLWRFGIADQRWRQTKVPEAEARIGTVFNYASLSNGSLMIVFNAYDRQLGDTTKDIYVWNLDTLQITKSKVLCPFYENHMQCVVMRDQPKAMLLAFGYFRECYKKHSSLPRLHRDIIREIGRNCVFEAIHLVSHHWNSKLETLHFKIDVNDILSNMESTE